MESFAMFLGYYALGAKIPDNVSSEFYNSSLELKDKDHYMIYNMLKNAPDLNDIMLRQMIMKLLKDTQ
jgi:hypothetical protein